MKDEFSKKIKVLDTTNCQFNSNMIISNNVLHDLVKPTFYLSETYLESAVFI